MKPFSREIANTHAMRSIYGHICRRLGKPIDKEATPENDGVLCYKWRYTEDKSSMLSYLIENFIHLNNHHFITFNPYNINHFDNNEFMIPELGNIIIFESDSENNYILLKHKWNKEYYKRYDIC